MKKVKVILFVIVLMCLNACIGGGTHGYIKAYRYRIPKGELESVVRQVIVSSSSIRQDTAYNYYNNDTTYITIAINDENRPYTYIFRYYGNKEYWDTSQTSEIFIAYAYDEKRNGGSAENGGVTKGNNQLRKRLLEPFEREFISKIDSMLGMEHTEE